MSVGATTSRRNEADLDERANDEQEAYRPAAARRFLFPCAIAPD